MEILIDALLLGTLMQKRDNITGRTKDDGQIDIQLKCAVLPKNIYR